MASISATPCFTASLKGKRAFQKCIEVYWSVNMVFATKLISNYQKITNLIFSICKIILSRRVRNKKIKHEI